MSAAPQIKLAMKVKVSVSAGPHKGLVLELEKPDWLIGRGNDCDLILSEDARSSRQHAQIRTTPDEVWITNMSQKNFVLVNGNKIENAKVNPGDIVQIGESLIQFDYHLPYLNSVSALANPENNVVNMPTAVPTMTMPSAPPVSFQNSPQHYPDMGALPPQQPQYQVKRNDEQEKAKKIRFYIIAAGLIGFILFMLMDNNSKSKSKRSIFRDSAQVEIEREQSEKKKEVWKERKEKLDSLQYKRAQENYIKGFRDFRQGQYARAYDSFQVVLNLDPENELAKQYMQLSRIKFDEQVKFAFLQGQRYREKQNYRMCASSFAQVMTMLQGQREGSTYKEAKQFYEECSLAKEGRF